jgi:biopolymer transport protein TolR
VSDDELIPKIQGAVAEKPGIQVLIRGDENVAYGRVVTVMASIKQAGIPSVGLMTRPPEG